MAAETSVTFARWQQGEQTVSSSEKETWSEQSQGPSQKSFMFYHLMSIMFQKNNNTCKFSLYFTDTQTKQWHSVQTKLTEHK